MSTNDRVKPPSGQGDKLLWILGGAVCVLAIAFFALLNMGGTDSQPAATATRTPAPAAGPAQATPQPAPAADYDVQLNRAQLALDAGMLIEPAGFSAWSIYSEILAADPGNADAGAGLAGVADSLADQAHAAFNAGQRDDARALAQHVLSRFPDHTDALDVIERIDRALSAARPQPAAVSDPVERVTAPPRRAAASESAAAPAATATPAAPPANPLAPIYGNFTRALADGRLRAPDQDNALTHFIALRDSDPDHAMTVDAGQQLLDAMFARHNEAFNQLDSSTSIEWLDLAESLNVDTARVTAAREQLMDFLAAQAAQESLSASEFTLLSYVAPEYPAAALRRDLEGWVDVAFVLSRDGRPTEIEVVDSSNSIFRDAATRAVGEWEFEPHTAYDRVVEQNAHTRIRFVLQD